MGILSSLKYTVEVFLVLLVIFFYTLHRFAYVPVSDLVLVAVVLAFALVSSHNSSQGDKCCLPAPASQSVVGLGGLSFREYVWRAHELGKLATKPDKRERLVGIGVSALVMLLWKIQGNMVRLSNFHGSMHQFKVMVSSLVVGKASRQWFKWLALRFVWLTHGVRWMKLHDVALAFCFLIFVLMCYNVPLSDWRVFVAQWLSQFVFGITVGEMTWCYVRWRLWNTWLRFAGWLDPLISMPSELVRHASAGFFSAGGAKLSAD